MSLTTRMLALVVLALPLATDPAASRACEAETGLDLYPDHALSPRESLAHYDTVFLGEVMVASRPCSLGACAGLRVVRTLKGEPGATTLVRVAKTDPSPCAATPFAAKGSRWMVFANGGTSKTGHRYLQVDGDGPTFAAVDVPDFDLLEGRYRTMRARLDSAIDARLGRAR